MKKTVLFCVTLCVLCACATMPTQAAARTYGWYCAHVKGHAQPPIGSDVAFVEELDGYYIDHRSDERVIYLTFDAGYENGNVAKTLDVLKEENVTAAFFILGNLITHDTDLVKRMVNEGHTVCNHTARHKDMSTWSDEAFLEELHALEALFSEHIGAEMAAYYRPPEGRFSRENLVCAQKNGYKTVFWSFAYPDWDNGKQMSPERAKQIILDNVHNGEVMLLHPTSQTNAAILGDVIRELKAQGYRFGTLDELTGQA
ncbi:MAG: polysaccharide deacetylase family protein [Clostridia bacterium]|nr:polysaccharide deacetylase family protein [Clostridia bacterium]